MSRAILMKDIQQEIQQTPTKLIHLYFPAFLATAGSFVMLFLRLEIGESFISDTGLMTLALASYILGALFQLTNLYAPSKMAEKISLWSATLGVFFNFSSWLVRWVNLHHFEIEKLRASGNMENPWIFRYIPFGNLYDLSLAFAFGAGITTLLIARRRNLQILSAFSLPLAAIILILARFIGGEYTNLMPILDSYWRPIHVGVASVSYGIALVCFAIAVAYLLKDNVKVEAMGIWAGLFAIAVFATISKFSVFTELVYRIGIFIPNTPKPILTPFRLELPYVGSFLVLSGILCASSILGFLIYLYKNSESARKIGHAMLKLALISQILAIGFLIYGVRTTNNVGEKLKAQLAANPSGYITAGRALVEKQQLSAQEFAQISPMQFEMIARQYLQENASKMYLSLNTNPVELSGLITALVGLLFIVLFSFRTEKLRERLPSLETLDNLMYKTASLTFAGLAMLLITGAIWANESWGRPWGFDPKETGALVAWLTYAAFLHARISRGWTGRSSAYFAIIGFLFIVFTYLGVSYLLPGLHSYA
jgi:cytochrome c-type biogenesis protein CcsB